MPNPKYQVSGRCPVCNEQMYVTRLECDNCHSALEGQFDLGPFHRLTPDQLQFLEVFIRSRGQNKAIQELLNISYPTVIKKLDELIIALGYEPEPVNDRRREVLELLSQGKINAAQAQQMLSGAANGAAKAPATTEPLNRNAGE
ncbi:MAG TPA: DUF2089 domain-containing protein [Chloroflexia bacterium]|nr:DUF2089 domain-containing protein [Chloroflexia bacterium]